MTREKLVQRLREARAHLEVSIVQSLPSDDAIIMGHVRDASELLRATIEALVPAPSCGACRAALTTDEREADSGLCWSCWGARIERCNQFVRECRKGVAQ